jgi:hypothetical protein
LRRWTHGSIRLLWRGWDALIRDSNEGAEID